MLSSTLAAPSSTIPSTATVSPGRGEQYGDTRCVVTQSAQARTEANETSVMRHDERGPAPHHGRCETISYVRVCTVADNVRRWQGRPWSRPTRSHSTWP